MRYIRIGRREFPPASLSPIASCSSVRFDGPFGTQALLQTSIPSTGIVGQKLNQTIMSPQFGDVERWRAGESFALDGYSPGQTFELTVHTSPTIAFDLEVFLSSTDDSGLYSTDAAKSGWDWEANLAASLGTVGPSGGVLTIPYATISPRFYNNCSFIIGAPDDFAGTNMVSGFIPTWLNVATLTLAIA